MHLRCLHRLIIMQRLCGPQALAGTAGRPQGPSSTLWPSLSNSAQARCIRRPAVPAHLGAPQHIARLITCSSSAPHTIPASTASLTTHTSIQPVPPDFPGEEALPFYSQFPLNRKASLRRNTEALSDLYASPTSRLVAISKDKVLVQAHPLAPAPTDPSAPPPPAIPTLSPVLLSPAAVAAAQHAATGAPTVFLGVDAQGDGYFAVEVADPAAVAAAAADAMTGASAAPGAGEGTQVEWLSARTAGQDLSPGDAALLAVASSLGQWHAGNGFHPATGAPTASTSGGHARKTTSAPGGAPTTRTPSLYPRVDPAVIMLVTAGKGGAAAGAAAAGGVAAGGVAVGAHMLNDWCLLGRKAEWPEGRYSMLAGFLEVGEPLELAVARETFEESGVTVALPSVTYAASQPWPFPRSLMVGFYASAAPANQQRPVAQENGKASNTTNGSTSSGTSGTSGSASSGASGSSGLGGGVPVERLWVPPAGATGYDLLPMEGRRAAIEVGITQQEVEEVLLPPLPVVHVDNDELEDCRWFHRDWLRACLLSPAGQYLPGAGPFCIPGRWSLAYRLITTWLHQPAPLVTQPAGVTSQDVTPSLQDEWAGDRIPQVAIDEGVFKYVLMRVRGDTAQGQARQKLIVWGDSRAAYHMDVFQRAKGMAVRQGLTVDVLGGGRIEHHSEQGVCLVYGFSGAFGAAPHEVAAALIRKWYPLYDPDCVMVSYQGY